MPKLRPEQLTAVHLRVTMSTHSAMNHPGYRDQQLRRPLQSHRITRACGDPAYVIANPLRNLYAEAET